MDGPTGRQTALVARLAPPRWYHPASGGALALLVASFATGLPAVVVAAVVGYVGALYVLPRACRRSTGVWYTGTVPPAPLRWSRRLTWTSVAAVLLGAVLGSTALAPAAAVVALAAYALVQVLGTRFDAELRAALLLDPEVAFKVEETEQ